jgi:hypothetical protein
MVLSRLSPRGPDTACCLDDSACSHEALPDFQKNQSRGTAGPKPIIIIIPTKVQLQLNLTKWSELNFVKGSVSVLESTRCRWDRLR